MPPLTHGLLARPHHVTLTRVHHRPRLAGVTRLTHELSLGLARLTHGAGPVLLLLLFSLLLVEKVLDDKRLLLGLYNQWNRIQI